jgi:hypothetical protein
LHYGLLQNTPQSAPGINDQPKTEPTRVTRSRTAKTKTPSKNNSKPIGPPPPPGPYERTEKDDKRRDRRTDFRTLNITHMKNRFNAVPLSYDEARDPKVLANKSFFEIKSLMSTAATTAIVA